MGEEKLRRGKENLENPRWKKSGVYFSINFIIKEI